MLMSIEPAWPPDFLAWNPETWEAFGTCATAVIAIAAAIFAWRQLRESARLRREQAEPYVAVAIESSAASQNIADLVVKNYGATAAFDVTLVIKPEAMRSKGEGGGVESVYIPEVLRTLVPNQEWRTFWDAGFTRSKTDLPDLYEATVTFYERPGKKRKYKHEYLYQLDFTSRNHTEYVRVHGLHDAAKALRDISGVIKSWSESGNVHGLAVYSRDGDGRDRRRSAEIEEMKRLHADLKAKRVATNHAVAPGAGAVPSGEEDQSDES